MASLESQGKCMNTHSFKENRDTMDMLSQQNLENSQYFPSGIPVSTCISINKEDLSPLSSWKFEGMGAGPWDKRLCPSDKDGLQDGDGLFVFSPCRGSQSPRDSPRVGALRGEGDYVIV
ncbi:hypothetical protein Lal_00030511 [Lupinus albus]|nr:hypothetical protein Lal_00030511 [Lupinus albus]